MIESDRCMNISLVEIINALVPAKGFAERLANAHPQHADAVAEFVSRSIASRMNLEPVCMAFLLPPKGYDGHDTT